MLLFSKQQWTLLLAELVVVVLGILIAFQVEEWRDGLAQRREIDAALVRLQEENQGRQQTCDESLPFLERRADAMIVLLTSLSSGLLESSDRAMFESAITTMAFNPPPPSGQTVIDEMIATGLLKSIENAHLRQSIADMARMESGSQASYRSDDRIIGLVQEELSHSVVFRYQGSQNLEALRNMGNFEEGITVEYEFEELAANRYLVNLLVEATDIRVDNHRNAADYCEVVHIVGEALQDAPSS